MKITTPSKEYSSIHEAYIEVLKYIYVNGQYTKDVGIEAINVSYHINNISRFLNEGFVITNQSRNWKPEYARAFYDWIMAGKTDASELFSKNTNAMKFHEISGRNTAYGPRILAQLDWIKEELSENRLSRRGVINILEIEDKELLHDKRSGASKMEYPCTFGLTYFIRGGELHCMANMRSNNMTTTVLYDLYNFIHLQAHICELLKDLKVNVKMGNYYHNIVNAHIVESEIALAKKILAEEFPDSHLFV